MSRFFIVNQLKTKAVKMLRRMELSLFPDKYHFSQTGYCPCCESETIFLSYDSWLRDNFKCRKCNSIPRERALKYIIEQQYPNWRNLHIHESSPNGGGFSNTIQRQSKNYIASHFFPGQAFGSTVNGFRNENVEQQTFADSVFDLVITGDVMEHVYEPEKAFTEIYRTLKPGGAHIFTTPLVNKWMPSQRWANLGADGKPIFLQTPEWHGNPINNEGAAVTMHWGYDIKDIVLRCTGGEVSIIYVDDLHNNLNHGIRGELNEVIVCRKPANV